MRNVKKQISLVATLLLFIIKTNNAQTVIINVNADSGRIPVSPYIYGRNNNLSDNQNSPLTVSHWQLYRDAGVRIMREGGGNNSTKYNWRLKLSSQPDWYNNVYVHDWDYAAQSLQTNLPGVQGFYSFQLIGKSAKSAAYNFNDYAYNQSQYWSGVEQNLAGNGIVNPVGGPNALKNGDTSLYLMDWPADSSVAIIDHWFGANGIGLDSTNFKYWDMDNEPEIWYSTHDDVINPDITAEAFMQLYFAVAKKARAKYPNIKLLGPIPCDEWQWYNWNNNGIEYEGKLYCWMEYFIKRVSEEEAATGIRFLDVIDLHFYPTTRIPTQIVQLHRIFFDRNYVYPGANGVKRLGAGGWDNSINKEYIFVRCRDWLTEYLGPNNGIGLSVSETGLSLNDPNISLCWFASTLGCFADNGVELFTPWSWQIGMWETLHLFSQYAKTTRIASTSTLENYVSAYSSVNKTNDSVTIIIVNRDTTGLENVEVNISNFNVKDGKYSMLKLSDLPSAETFVSSTNNALHDSSIAVFKNSFNVTLPSLSVSAFILTGTGNVTRIHAVKNNNEFNLKLFPVPVNNSSKIEYNINNSGMVKLEIFDVMGKQIYVLFNKYHFSGTYNVALKSGMLKNGTYFLRITTGSDSQTKPFIVLQ